MQFLIDKSPADVARKEKSSRLVAGQLLTPLTRYANWGGVFAIDNGAFSGLRAGDFKSLISREQSAGRIANCLFVACPDIVGNCRRTTELWPHRHQWIPREWPIAYVAQNGAEDMDIPWNDLDALFLGGVDPWKDSVAAQDIVKAAKALGKHVHIGRVNTAKRYDLFASLGADTCDGSGVAMYDHMLDAIENRVPHPELELSTPGAASGAREEE